MITRLKTLISEQLHQGTTPKALAKATTFGILLGNFPVFGMSTWMCILLGTRLKLNQPILQIVNYAMSPSQLLLVPVFVYIGELIVGAPHQTFVPSEVLKEFAADKSLFFQHFGMLGVHAIIAWVLIAPFAGVILYFVSKFVYTKVLIARSR